MKLKYTKKEKAEKNYKFIPNTRQEQKEQLEDCKMSIINKMYDFGCEEYKDAVSDLIDLQTGHTKVKLSLNKPLEKCKTLKEATEWGMKYFGFDTEAEFNAMIC